MALEDGKAAVLPSGSSLASAPAPDSASTPAPAPVPSPASSSPHVRYSLKVDTSGSISTGRSAAGSMAPPVSALLSGTVGNRPGSAPVPAPAPTSAFPLSPTSPRMRRRPTRAATFCNVVDFDKFELRPGWQPGAEPGIDTSKPDGGRATLAHMNAPSDITVVDYSPSDMSVYRLDNKTLGDFLAQPQPPHTNCRWINVNGLSWDVIQLLGNHKKLHRLAIEDLMNTRNRTKTDWYPTHTYMVLTLQKLVTIDKSHPSADDESSSDGSDSETDARSLEGRASDYSFWEKLVKSAGRLFRRSDNAGDDDDTVNGNGDGGGDGTFNVAPGGPSKDVEMGRVSLAATASASSDNDPRFGHINEFRTLQRYHASPSDSRTDFIERHSGLSPRNLAIAAEQVSIFLTDDNTVISFFELSAEDIEAPILKRLAIPDTSLRRSCDASMIVQAILDGIIDLAIPVTMCYGDVIADLELDVLTRPSVNHTKCLYITITEINKVMSFINPIMTLINALRDHKADKAAAEDLQNTDKGVTISPMARIYLADVLDHCVLITESLEQVKSQSENMISLIFNTISAYQNESMKQLTIVTIIFLPLTFLTGYFGQNFDGFQDLQRGIPYFWKIAGPVIFFTIIIMMREMITDYVKSLVQRRRIVTIKRRRRNRKKRQ